MFTETDSIELLQLLSEVRAVSDASTAALETSEGPSSLYPRQPQQHHNRPPYSDLSYTVPRGGNESNSRNTALESVAVLNAPSDHVVVAAFSSPGHEFNESTMKEVRTPPTLPRPTASFKASQNERDDSTSQTPPHILTNMASAALNRGGDGDDGDDGVNQKEPVLLLQSPFVERKGRGEGGSKRGGGGGGEATRTHVDPRMGHEKEEAGDTSAASTVRSLFSKAVGGTEAGDATPSHALVAPLINAFLLNTSAEEEEEEGEEENVKEQHGEEGRGEQQERLERERRGVFGQRHGQACLTTDEDPSSHVFGERSATAVATAFSTATAISTITPPPQRFNREAAFTACDVQGGPWGPVATAPSPWAATAAGAVAAPLSQFSPHPVSPQSTHIVDRPSEDADTHSHTGGSPRTDDMTECVVSTLPLPPTLAKKKKEEEVWALNTEDIEDGCAGTPAVAAMLSSLSQQRSPQRPLSAMDRDPLATALGGIGGGGGRGGLGGSGAGFSSPLSAAHPATSVLAGSLMSLSPGVPSATTLTAKGGRGGGVGGKDSTDGGYGAPSDAMTTTMMMTTPPTVVGGSGVVGSSSVRSPGKGAYTLTCTRFSPGQAPHHTAGGTTTTAGHGDDENECAVSVCSSSLQAAGAETASGGRLYRPPHLAQSLRSPLNSHNNNNNNAGSAFQRSVHSLSRSPLTMSTGPAGTAERASAGGEAAVHHTEQKGSVDGGEEGRRPPTEKDAADSADTAKEEVVAFVENVWKRYSATATSSAWTTGSPAMGSQLAAGPVSATAVAAAVEAAGGTVPPEDEELVLIQQQQQMQMLQQHHQATWLSSGSTERAGSANGAAPPPPPQPAVSATTANWMAMLRGPSEPHHSSSAAAATATTTTPTLQQFQTGARGVVPTGVPASLAAAGTPVVGGPGASPQSSTPPTTSKVLQAAIAAAAAAAVASRGTGLTPSSSSTPTGLLATPSQQLLSSFTAYTPSTVAAAPSARPSSGFGYRREVIPPPFSFTTTSTTAAAAATTTSSSSATLAATSSLSPPHALPTAEGATGHHPTTREESTGAMEAEQGPMVPHATGVVMGMSSATNPSSPFSSPSALREGSGSSGARVLSDAYLAMQHQHQQRTQQQQQQQQRQRQSVSFSPPTGGPATMMSAFTTSAHSPPPTAGAASASVTTTSSPPTMFLSSIANLTEAGAPYRNTMSASPLSHSVVPPVPPSTTVSSHGHRQSPAQLSTRPLPAAAANTPIRTTTFHPSAASATTTTAATSVTATTDFGLAHRNAPSPVTKTGMMTMTSTQSPTPGAALNLSPQHQHPLYRTLPAGVSSYHGSPLHATTMSPQRPQSRTSPLAQFNLTSSSRGPTLQHQQQQQQHGMGSGLSPLQPPPPPPLPSSSSSPPFMGGGGGLAGSSPQLYRTGSAQSPFTAHQTSFTAASATIPRGATTTIVSPSAFSSAVESTRQGGMRGNSVGGSRSYTSAASAHPTAATSRGGSGIVDTPPHATTTTNGTTGSATTLVAASALSPVLALLSGPEFVANTPTSATLSPPRPSTRPGNHASGAGASEGDSPVSATVQNDLQLLRSSHAMPRATGPTTSAFLPNAASSSSAAAAPSVSASSNPTGPMTTVAQRVLAMSRDQQGCRTLQAVLEIESGYAVMEHSEEAQPPQYGQAVTSPTAPGVTRPSTNSTASAAAVVAPIATMTAEEAEQRFLSSVPIQRIVSALTPVLDVVMADDYGNFLVQKVFEVAPDSVRRRLLAQTALREHLGDVACSPHGTFAVQRLIETLRGDVEEDLVFAALKKDALRLFTDMNGGHVLNKVMTYLKLRYLAGGSGNGKDHTAAAAGAGAGATTDGVECVRRKADFMYRCLLENLEAVCKHKLGCCTVKNLIDFFADVFPVPTHTTPISGNDVQQQQQQQVPWSTSGKAAGHTPSQTSTLSSRSPKRPLLNTARTQNVAAHLDDDNCFTGFVACLLPYTADFAMNAYANYVVNHIVEVCYTKGSLQLVDAVAQELQNELIVLCMNKFASNVVERVLRHSSDRRTRSLCRTLLASSPSSSSGLGYHTAKGAPAAAPHPALLDVAMDQYGNYVVQTLLTVAPVDELEPSLALTPSTTTTTAAATATATATATAAAVPPATQSAAPSGEVGILSLLQQCLPTLRERNFGKKMEMKMEVAKMRVSQYRQLQRQS